MQPQLVIHTALQCEANALINELQLAFQVRQSGRIYLSADKSIVLLVSGVGYERTIRCCSHWTQSAKNALWLNIGIAGHRTLKRASVCWASRIEDASSKQKYYPHFFRELDVDALVPLITYNSAQSAYPPDALVDMEAAAMYAVASRTTTLENIHSLKVVSDNSKHGMDTINKNTVQQLMRASLPKLMRMIICLRERANHPQKQVHQRITQCYQRIAKHYSPSTTQQHQLYDLLRRALACDMKENHLSSFFDGNDKQSLKRCMQLLRTHVQREAER